MIIVKILAVLLITICLNANAIPQINAAGFQEISAYNLKIGIWYPTQEPETKGQLGPFDVELAFNAKPENQGKFQPVLISHGNSGRYRNHHTTAKKLANEGFIVIAPLHSADHLIGTDDTYTAINWRTQELAHALEAVLQIEQFRNKIDLSHIHGIGYSLGAVSVLNAAGATINGNIADQHCQTNQDPAFCELPGFLVRWQIKRLRGVTTPELNRDIPKKYTTLPFINGNIALIAPVGQGIEFHENIFQAKKIFITAYQQDTITIPKFHAQKITEIIPEKYIRHFSIRPGNHHAFIAPFAKRVTDHEQIPAAQDPPEFNRADALEKLNAELVRFFALK